ncbi:hypothetical protein PsW64_04802 [Pseudovibrio sp. W64]|uniref:hypothetical protein n=1 Tax=Pseudovibrio sp. W64 TaxID=1735583 RepID=UPI0007AE41E8|nr:hypothetical protein [Pseudovibrio sp. W64]KZK76643.1 hypothetical protein PsW64_04802 [Pseudovibrio sp. W64]
MTTNNNTLPILTTNADFILTFLRAVNRGTKQSKIKEKNPDIDVDHVYKTLTELGLIEHIAIASIRGSKGSVYFLTDKGQKWLHTYGYWEHWRYKLSKWQVLGGVILAITVNFITNWIWPFISPDRASQSIDEQVKTEMQVKNSSTTQDTGGKKILEEDPAELASIQEVTSVPEAFFSGLSDGMEFFGFALPFIVTAILVWILAIEFGPVRIIKLRAKLKDSAKK